MTDTNFKGAKSFYNYGLELQSQGRRASASGNGSSLEQTQSTREFIPHLVDKYDIQSVLDLGCGDYHWMREIRCQFPATTYEGWDANEEEVLRLNETYGDKKTNFACKDIITEEYPLVDMVICRDVLFHLRMRHTKKIIENMRRAGIKYFLSTTHLEVLSNTDITPDARHPDWGFYLINLNIEPFNLHSSMLEYNEESVPLERGKKRYLALYKIS